MKTLKKTLCLVLMLSLVFALMAPGFAFADNEKTEAADEADDVEEVDVSEDGIEEILNEMAENMEECDNADDQIACGWLANAEMLYVLAYIYDENGDYEDDIEDAIAALDDLDDDATAEDVSVASSAACVTLASIIVTALDEEGTLTDDLDEFLTALDEANATEDADQVLVNATGVAYLLYQIAALVDEDSVNSETLEELVNSLSGEDAEEYDITSALAYIWGAEALIIAANEDIELDSNTTELEDTVNDSTDDESESDDISGEDLEVAELTLSAAFLGAWALSCVEAAD